MKTKTFPYFFWLSMVVSVTTVNAQYYADELIKSGPCDPITLLCGSGVENPEYAVDLIGGTYATMNTIIGANNNSFLRVGFSHPIAAGSRIGVFIQAGSIILNADVLEALEVRLFDENGTLVGKKTKFKTADLELLTGTGDLNVISVGTEEGYYTISAVKIILNGLVSVLNNVRIYGVAAVPDCAQYPATSVFSEGPCDPIVPIFCPGGVLNSGNSVSASTTDYATLSIPLGIGGTAYIDLAFEPDGNDGDRISFLIGQNNTLLDADLLANLSLKVYDQNGNLVKQKSKFTPANLETSLIDPSRSTIGLTTPKGDYTINHARLTLTSLVSVLSDLRVYRATTKETTNFTLNVTADGPLTFCTGDHVKLTSPGSEADYAFQWYKDNEAIAGATNKKYTATTTGAYHVLRTGGAGCGATNFLINVDVNCKEAMITEHQLQVYPNPFSDQFQVTLGEPASAEGWIRIMDVSGKVLFVTPWNSAENLELGEDLVPGVYLLQLYDGINSGFNKVIKVE